MKLRTIPLLLVVLLLLFPGSFTAQAQDAQAIVHAVLFYSPSCGHCHYVMTKTLPPLLEQYGEQFQIMGVDVSQPDGQTLFLAALQKFGLERGGVPFLVIDDLYLVGSLDIPEKFPGLVQTYLAQGGVDWPDIPGLHEVLYFETQPTTDSSTNPTGAVQAAPVPATVSPLMTSPTGAPGLLPTEDGKPGWRDRFASDPSGNMLALLVLVGMLASFVWAITNFQKSRGASLRSKSAWAIPVLSIVGLAVAGYLAYVETTQVTAVCGPVGDCNTVQQSEYARLFGILPIGVLGAVGYVAIIITWLVGRYTSSDQAAYLAAISLVLMTVSGTLFSMYLTFLEPFVIGATCAWCLTSAILMTILMLLSIGIFKQVMLKNTPSKSLWKGIWPQRI